MIVAGFSWPIYTHNSVAAVLDGKLVFASEEDRYTRHYRSREEAPISALRSMFEFLKNEYDIRPEEVTDYAIDKDPSKFRLWKFPILQKSLVPLFDARLGRTDAAFNKLPEVAGAVPLIARNPDAGLAKLFIVRVFRSMGLAAPQDIRIHPVEHQLAHAASAHYFSGAHSGAVVVADGYGEIEHTTVWDVKKGEFEKIAGIPNRCGSFGILYGKIAEAIDMTPWQIGDLSAWGSYDAEMHRRFSSLMTSDKKLPCCIKGRARRLLPQSESEMKRRLYGPIIEEVLQGKDMRWADKGKLRKDIADIAWCGQDILEKSVLKLVSWAKDNTSRDLLGMAGVTFLNNRVNAKVRNSGMFKDVFVFPASDDAGSPAGAAAYVYEHVLGGRIERKRLTSMALGPKYDSELVKKTIWRGAWKTRNADANGVARLISKGRVVACYQGRSEFGPRALGNRNVFAKASSDEARIRLGRAARMWWWRARSAAVLASEAKRYFVNPTQDPFMDFLLEPNKDGAARLLLARQPDNLMQIHTVTKKENANFYELLRAIKDIGGNGAVGSANFALPREPLVETPADAIRSFSLGGFDDLYIDGLLISKT
ncbi:Uncharacterised protein [uncultured archaeon]|nr:Uncharacterised protein [uncultured archaeon]